DAVAESVLDDLDRSALDSEHLSDEGCEPRHRTSQLAAEDRGQLLHLLVRRSVVDEHAETPVSFGHDLRGVGDHGERATADVRPFDVALADVEHQSDAAVVVRGAVVEREVARAHELAGARLEVGPLDAPGHVVLLSRSGQSSILPCRYPSVSTERSGARTRASSILG